jgi:hypothetical protein
MWDFVTGFDADHVDVGESATSRKRGLYFFYPED